MTRRPQIVRTGLVAACLLIAACAQDPAYRSGMQLIAEGRTDEGLAQLELAMRQAPQNVETPSSGLHDRHAKRA